MEPLEKFAGVGAAVVGSLTTLIQMPLGTLIGHSYNGTLFPLVFGIAILIGLSIIIVNWVDAKKNGIKLCPGLNKHAKRNNQLVHLT